MVQHRQEIAAMATEIICTLIDSIYFIKDDPNMLNKLYNEYKCMMFKLKKGNNYILYISTRLFIIIHIDSLLKPRLKNIEFNDIDFSIHPVSSSASSASISSAPSLTTSSPSKSLSSLSSSSQKTLKKEKINKY